jgi:ankyrin repeat protein
VNYKDSSDALEVTKLLFDSGADITQRDENLCMAPVQFAAEMGHLEVVKYLEEKGGKVKEKDMLSATLQCINAGTPKLLQYLVDRDPANMASDEKLIAMSRDGELLKLEAYIKVGANRNAKDGKGRGLLELLGVDAHEYVKNDKKWQKELASVKKLLQVASKKSKAK